MHIIIANYDLVSLNLTPSQSKYMLHIFASYICFSPINIQFLINNNYRLGVMMHSDLSHSSVHLTVWEDNERWLASQFQRTLLEIADSTTTHKYKQEKCLRITLHCTGQASITKPELLFVISATWVHVILTVLSNIHTGWTCNINHTMS